VRLDPDCELTVGTAVTCRPIFAELRLQLLGLSSFRYAQEPRIVGSSALWHTISAQEAPRSYVRSLTTRDPEHHIPCIRDGEGVNPTLGCRPSTSFSRASLNSSAFIRDLTANLKSPIVKNRR
jgi:hypothetical protein